MSTVGAKHRHILIVKFPYIYFFYYDEPCFIGGCLFLSGRSGLALCQCFTANGSASPSDVSQRHCVCTDHVLHLYCPHRCSKQHPSMLIDINSKSSHQAKGGTLWSFDLTRSWWVSAGQMWCTRGSIGDTNIGPGRHLGRPWSFSRISVPPSLFIMRVRSCWP